MKYENNYFPKPLSQVEKNDYFTFVKDLEFYNNGINGSYEYYQLVYSFLRQEFDKLRKNKVNNINDVNNFKNKWDDINYFINNIFKYIEKNYNKLKEYKLFAELLGLDDLIEYQRQIWEIRKSNLDIINPKKIF